MSAKKRSSPLKTLILAALVFYLLGARTETLKTAETEVTQSAAAQTEISQQEDVSMTNLYSGTQKRSAASGSVNEHLYLRYRGNGDCSKMTGSVMPLFIFVDDAETSWTDQQIDDYLKQINSQITEIQNAARGFGVYPQFSIYYAHVSTDKLLTDNGDISSNCTHIIQKVGLTSTAKANEYLEETYGMDDAPIFIVVNKPGRACAYSSTVNTGCEYAILYEDASPFWHELNHLFGARDLYYPASVAEAAELFLTGSIMLDSSSHIIDELTAYLIGWTDELSSCALGFLGETASLTQEEINQANREEQITGYSTKTYTNGTYTGYLVDGFFQGQGTFRWNNGDVYEGEWVNGNRTGWGTYYWADGDVYVGEFLNGALHGQGKLTYNNGTVRSGRWNEGNYMG